MTEIHCLAYRREQTAVEGTCVSVGLCPFLLVSRGAANSWNIYMELLTGFRGSTAVIHTHMHDNNHMHDSHKWHSSHNVRAGMHGYGQLNGFHVLFSPFGVRKTNSRTCQIVVQ